MTDERILPQTPIPGAMLHQYFTEELPDGHKINHKYTWRDAIGCCPAPEGSISTDEAIARARGRECPEHFYHELSDAILYARLSLRVTGLLTLYPNECELALKLLVELQAKLHSQSQ